MAVTVTSRVPAFPRDAILAWLAIMLVLFSVFNDFPAILPVGEYAKEGVIFILPLAFLYVLLFHSFYLVFPQRESVLFFLIFLTVLISGILNYDDIASTQFKGRSGISRIITQGISLTFGIAIFYLFYNLTVRRYLSDITFGALCGLIVMAVVGFFEFSSWFSLPGLTQVHEVIEATINASGPYLNRLRMTAFEVSWASVVMTFIFPFAIAHQSLRPMAIGALTALALILILLTQSRTALLILFSQGVLFGFFYFRRRVDLLIFTIFGLGVVAALIGSLPGLRDSVLEAVSNIIVYGNVSGNIFVTETNISNITRWAAIRSGVEIFLSSPVWGIGLGQYGFEYPNHVQAADMASYEVRFYTESGDPRWPPAYSFHIRMLAELGIAGLGLWLAIVIPLLVYSVGSADVRTAVGRLHLAVAMTLVGWLMLGFSIDSFRFVGGWVALGVGAGLRTLMLGAEAGARAPVGGVRSTEARTG